MKQIKHQIEETLKRLFLSRHFLVFIASILLIVFNKIDPNTFFWLMVLVMGTNTLEKMKDNIKIGK